MQEKKKDSGFVYADSSDIEGTYRIQPNDNLYIGVTSVEGVNTAFFNPPLASNTTYSESNQVLVGYYVNDEGYIYFPFLGELQVQGMTLDEARDILTERIKKYVNQPIVTIKLINNTISLIGEFNSQGTYRITKAKLTVYEAVSMAGGFTPYAKLNKVKLVRQTTDGPIIQTLDLSNKEILLSDLYYVYPNDLLYAEPMKAKTWGIGPTFSLALFTSLITLYLLLKTL
ncbi:MAG: polysaccharide biosynthesis/export family protein [Bacteroidetes bacterium]|nr:polysaccharide biosynthesis/export family protein [Bacteroidota bacterium]